MDDDLLSIGRFARLSGLSVGALRHYDELDLLRPADIDRFTGYRRYRREQLETARTIARLRDLEVPLDEIREVLAMDDPAEQRRRLAVHRARIAARSDRLTRLLHVVGRMTDGKDPIMTNTISDPTAATTRRAGRGDPSPARRRPLQLDLDADREAGPDAGRDRRDDPPRPRVALALGPGRPAVNLARGEWLCSRVYATLGRGEPALWHARRCVEINEAIGDDEGRESWDLPGPTRRWPGRRSPAATPPAARSGRRRPLEALAAIDNADDRMPIEQDLATLPG